MPLLRADLLERTGHQTFFLPATYVESRFPFNFNPHIGETIGQLLAYHLLAGPQECTHAINPSFSACSPLRTLRNIQGKYLYYADVYAQYTLEFDGIFGPYSVRICVGARIVPQVPPDSNAAPAGMQSCGT